MAISPFKTKKEKNKFLILSIFLSVVGFLSVRHYLANQWSYEGYFIMFFYFAPAIIAVGLWYIYFTANVDE